MRRGDLTTVALSGGFGKPRPALVIQSDFLAETDSVLVCLLTSTLRAAPLYRLSLAAGEATGLREPSQVMVDRSWLSAATVAGSRPAGQTTPP